MSPLQVDGAPVQIGIDVGGTFTDIVAAWPSGMPARAKVLSTPHDPASGVMAACALLAAELGIGLDALLARATRFGLGTTVITNILATSSGRNVGLITTKGFEDIMPLVRGERVSDKGWLVPSVALVSRARIAGVDERVDSRGNILRSLQPADVIEAGRYLIEEGQVDRLVVSFLWSFREPSNERAAVALLSEHFPAIPVISAVALAPVIREYERTQFALINAYTDGGLDWLAPLEGELRQRGLTAPLHLMHSNGGAVSLAAAYAAPAGLAQSGPAAGAAACASLAASLGIRDAVTCDLGGTSLDVALIRSGEAMRRSRGHLVGHWTALSMVDIDSVGSGGGSIAWVDNIGALRVGPRSAGAVPGPACYGQQQDEATLTDALVVLGYLDSEALLGGRMKIDADAAFRVCERLSENLGLGVIETAWGIREIALAVMSRSVRQRIASRGLSPADLDLIGFGGCCGLFAADITSWVGAKRAVLPMLASVFSAFGAASCSLRSQAAVSVARSLPVELGLLERTATRVWSQAIRELVLSGVDDAEVRVQLEVDMRFERQGSELTIPLPGLPPGELGSVDLGARFRAEYERRFGSGAFATGVGIDVVTVRAVSSGPGLGLPSLAAQAPRAGAAGPRAETGPVAADVAVERLVHVRRDGQPVRVQVLARRELAIGAEFAGPLLVDDLDTTTWVPPGYRAKPDEYGTLLIERCSP